MANSSVTLNIPTPAAQSDMETATDVTLMVTPGRTKFHPGVLKVSCRLTVSGGTPTIGVSYNTSSVTDNGVGDFTINFTTSFSAGTEYSTVGMASYNTPNGRILQRDSGTAQGSGSVRIVCLNRSDGSLVDGTEMAIVCAGDQ